MLIKWVVLTSLVTAVLACSPARELPADFNTGGNKLTDTNWMTYKSREKWPTTHTVNFKSDGTFKVVYKAYIDRGYSRTAYTQILTGTYSMTDLKETATGTTSGKLDIVYVKDTLSVDNDLQAAMWNKEAYCGITAWKPGTFYDITGQPCSALDGNLAMYDIFAKSKRELRFGLNDASHDGYSANGRPSQIYKDLVYLPK